MSWSSFKGWQSTFVDPPMEPVKPKRELTLADFRGKLPERHRGYDPYIGLEHREVDWKPDPRARGYRVTCACGAVLLINEMEVQ